MKARTIYVSPDGGKRRPEDEAAPVKTKLFQDAIDAVRPGDTIQLLAGVYDTPVIVEGKGDPRNPIRIVGLGQATLDGRRNSVRQRDIAEMDRKDYAFVRIVDCGGIVLDGLTLQNVWPTAIYIENSHDIHIRQMSLNAATYGILAKGAKTQRILVERCSWLQDPAIWDQVSWTEIHERPYARRELDGDFFRSLDIAGDVTIRNNYISHAFNGLHLRASKDRDTAGVRVNDNVWIYENTFTFIRDNAVEAEHTATNWFVFANKVLNCHVWLAFEECKGGFWYVFGNQGWFTRKQGPPHDCFTGGGVIKASNNEKRLPDDPFYFFNNSFYVRGPYLKKGKLKNFEHFHNAVEFARERFHHEGLVIEGRNPFGATVADPRCEGNHEPAKPFTRDWGGLSIAFRNDIWDHPLYPDEIRKMGWPVSGIGASPGFASGRSGDFTLVKDSACRGAGKQQTMKMAKGRPWVLPEELDIGAVQERPRADGSLEVAPCSAEMLRCPRSPALPLWLQDAAVS